MRVCSKLSTETLRNGRLWFYGIPSENQALSLGEKRGPVYDLLPANYKWICNDSRMSQHMHKILFRMLNFGLEVYSFHPVKKSLFSFPAGTKVH